MSRSDTKKVYYSLEELSQKYLLQVTNDTGQNHKKSFINILKLPIDINVHDHKKNNLLHYAAKIGSNIMTKYLINNGCNVNLKNNLGDTPLVHAILQENIEIIKMLLDAGTILDQDYYPEKNTPLHLIFNYGIYKSPQMVKIVKLLCDHGCDAEALNNRKESPLKMAIKENMTEIIKVFIDTGINLNKANKKGQTIIHEAIQNSGGVDAIELLVNQKPNLDKRDNRGRVPLYYAITTHNDNNDRVVKALIKAGAKIDWKSNNGRTLLHYASAYLRHDVLKTLLVHGAPVNVYDINGLSPLSCSFYRDSILLLMIRSIEKNKHSIMNLISRRFNCIELLLDYGIDLDHHQLFSLTALETALKTSRHCKAITKFLLYHEAKFDYLSPIIYRKFCKPWSRSKSAPLLLRHTALFEAQNRSYCVSYFDYDNLTLEPRNYYITCKKELELMKISYVTGSMSLFKLLTKQVVGFYARNNQLAIDFNSGLISKNFPIYKDLLRFCWMKECIRLNLLPDAVKGLLKISNIHENLLFIPFEIVLNYLSEKDMHSLALV